MRRIYVRKVTVQSFRAFQHQQSSPELPLTGLVGLRGFNKDTGGSSGAGKSSVAYAIAYAFDFLPFSAQDQQNWHSDSPMQVALELDTPEGPAVLMRGKETSLTWNGETIKGSARAVAEAIKKMWGGVDSDLIKALTFRQQGKRGRFLTMKDAERKEFLTMLLGLGEIEEQIGEAVKKANQLELQANEVQSTLITLEQQLQEPVRPELGDLTSVQDRINDLQSRLPSLTAKKMNAETELELKAQELEKQRPHPSMYVRIGHAQNGQPLRDIVEKLEEAKHRLTGALSLETAHRDRIKSQAAKLKTVIDGLTEIAGREAQLTKELSQTKGDIEYLKESKCQTCDRIWGGAASELERKNHEHRHLVEQLAVSIRAKHMLSDRKAEYAQLLKEAEEYELPSVAQLQAIADDLLQKKNQEVARLQALSKLAEVEAQRDYAVALEAYNRSCESQLKDLEMQVSFCTNAVETAKRDLEAWAAQQKLIVQTQKMYDSALASYEALKNRIAVKEQEYAQLKKKANEEADYAAMVKSFLIAYFEEVLNEISAEANEVLKSIPNTPTTTVQFVTETQTAKGVTKQEIKPVVTKNGVVINLESGVSGGQMESVELAVDLSVSKVIGGRTGVQPGFMIFDESFSSHCLPVKQACMAVLAQAATDAMILVVDHATELQDSFASFVDVESEHDVSRFKL
jgi:DNA repair exonuclease SbcCD ATPase subunit